MAMLLLVMIAGLGLSGQEAGPPREAPMTASGVEVEGAAAEEAEVMLECGADRNRALRDCIIISETPPGQGFGQAALDSARGARLSRQTRSRAPADRFRFAVRFRIADRDRP